MFRFYCNGLNCEQAEISVLSVDWSIQGDVKFSCNDDEFACLLLSGCRSDSGGFFNLLAGTKPVYIEQWLEYLEEQQKIRHVSVKINLPDDQEYNEALGFSEENIQQLLPMIFKVGGFNKLQINRYLKQLSNPATLSTRYGPAELQRYRILNDIIRLLNKLRR